jgi:hypothetical protein
LDAPHGPADGGRRPQFAGELDGKSFYYEVRNRVLRLEEYFQSLENLIKAQVFNPATRRASTLEDAKHRWEEVKKQAQEDQRNCDLVRSLPELEKQVEEVQKQAAADESRN